MLSLVLRSDPPPPLPRARPGEAILVASLVQAENARVEFDQFVRDRRAQRPFEGLFISLESMFRGSGFRCALLPAPFVDQWE